jgi:hypothetical protein
MLYPRKCNETENWTKISSYGPKFHPAVGIAIYITFIVLGLAFSFVSDFFEANEDIYFEVPSPLGDVVVVILFIIIIIGIIYIFSFVLGKGFGPNQSKITLYEEGFVYRLKNYQLISKWKDVTKIELSEEIPTDKFNSILGLLISKNTHKVEPRLIARLSTKNGNTEGINGFINGRYILPQEIQTSDLSLGTIGLMNEHCANMLYCIARRAINAEWTGELSGINKLGWDIKIPKTKLL